MTRRNYQIWVTYRGYDHRKDDQIRTIVKPFGGRETGSGTDFTTRDVSFDHLTRENANKAATALRAKRFGVKMYEDLERGHSVPRRNPPLSGVRSIGPNMTEADHGDLGILYSYRTPVAILAPSGLYRTSTHHSNTTARQIAKWGRLHGLDTKGAKRISQNAIEWAATNGVDPAETVDLPTTSHSGGEHEFKSNPGKFADTIEEMLYGTDHDQTMGEADGPLGWMGLVSGMTIREAREVAETLGIELDRNDIDDYDWPLNAIIIENDQGFIDVTTYKSNRDVIRVWRELEKELEGFETGEA